MRYGGFGFNQQFGFTAPAQDTVAAAPPAQASWPALIGAEMMVNGDCSSGTGWAFNIGSGTGQIVAGKMQLVAAEGGVTNSGVAASAFVEGGSYRTLVTADSITLRSFTLGIGATVGTNHSTAGTYSEDLIAFDLENEGGWKIFLDDAGPATMQLDNFSVKSVGLMGVEADWTLVDVTFDSGALNLPGDVFTADLVGAAKTTFDADVSNSTVCSVTISTNLALASYLNGTITVAMKGGAGVVFVFDDSGDPVTHQVTSGTGSGFSLSGNSAGYIARVQIALA